MSANTDWLYSVAQDPEHLKMLRNGSAVFVIVSTRTAREVTPVAITREMAQDDSVENSLINIIGQKLLSVDGVTAVYFNLDEQQTTVDVWTILKQAQPNFRKHVYEKELELIDEFPNLIFNFRTTDEEGEATPASADFKFLRK